MEPSLTRSVVLATTIVLGAAFAPTASAFATYDAEASVSLTLQSVVDSAGAASPGDFSVEAFGLGAASE